MAVTKDAAESPVVRGGPAEPMGKCDKGWNRAGVIGLVSGCP